MFRGTHRSSSGAKLIAPSGFPLKLDSGWQPQMYVKPEAAIAVFELLMMSGVSLETS
jgi:hypothetical protein